MKQAIGCGVVAAVGLLIMMVIDPAGFGCASRGQRAFLDEVKSQVCPIAARYIGPTVDAASANASGIRVRGRCVLIALTDSDAAGIDWVSEWLQDADDDRALEPDPDVSEEHTVFVVHSREWGQVGYYQGILPTGRAYRARFDICVIYWPGLEFAGVHTIISDPPEETQDVGSKIGNEWDVTRWVNQLPLDTEQ